MIGIQETERGEERERERKGVKFVCIINFSDGYSCSIG